VRDYWALRRLASNPYEVLRFRKSQTAESELEVCFRGRPSLFLRGGRADFHMFHRIFLRDEYRLRPILSPDSCVLDLGGNVGVFSARVAPEVHRVIVYEPVPENFDRLRANTSGFPNLQCNQAAVSGDSGKIEIFMPANDKLTGVYSAHPDGNELLSTDSVTVDAVSLDRVFDQHQIERCDLLKIDVEGAEYEILGRASRLTLDKIQRIHGEYHDVVPASPTNRIEGFTRFLEEIGFIVDVDAHRRKPNHGMFFAHR